LLSPDCDALPVFETNWIAGKLVAEEVLTLIAMLLPCDPVVPLSARSGEIAPFHANSVVPPALPDWSTVPVAGSTSYQRSSAPGPPYTACAVQIATALPWSGSAAATAASKRPSRVSSR